MKGPNSLIPRRKKGYASDVIELELVPHVKQLVQNQYLVQIPTFRLKQLFLSQEMYLFHKQ